jgi:hypothetical protein
MFYFNDFKINRDKDSLQIFEDIKNFIDTFSQQEVLKKNIYLFSKIFEIPENILNLKLKKLIYNLFDFNNGNFVFKFNIISLLYFYFINIIIFLYIFIFGKNVIDSKDYDIIIEDFDSYSQLERFSKLVSHYNKVLFVIDKYSIYKNFKKKKIDNIYSLIQQPNKKYFSGKYLTYLKFLNSLFYISIKYRFNFLYFFSKIFLSIFKNNNIYSTNKSNILIQDRFYKICPIRNYIFKKNGGKVTSCTQIHLAESGISFYVDIDVLFTFGNEVYTKSKLSNFGSIVKKTYPIGSHKMEHGWFMKEIPTNLIPSIDLLVIGVNPIHWMISNKLKKDYYNFLNWVKTFSVKYPKFNIFYKHHENFKGDKLEEKILEGSNIKIIIKNNVNNSYLYLEKSKIAVSYGSTMILEGMGNKKNCYFVDPNLSATTFYGMLLNLNNIIISDYESFERIVLKVVLDETSNNFNISDNNEICLNSNNVSGNIFTFFENLKKRNYSI